LASIRPSCHSHFSHAAANDFFDNVKYPGRQLRHISANETVSCKASLRKKGRTMSSEQMRVELESFVNKGLKEGWRGWPLKSQPPCRERFHNLYSMPAAAGFFGCVQQIALREMSHLSPTILRN
jgi:hypothetical protein